MSRHVQILEVTKYILMDDNLKIPMMASCNDRPVFTLVTSIIEFEFIPNTFIFLGLFRIHESLNQVEFNFCILVVFIFYQYVLKHMRFKSYKHSAS